MKNKIYEELLDVAPTLASLEKQNPFKVPDGYFSTLENRTLDAMDKKPILGPTTPVGYFDDLVDRVLVKAQEKEEAQVFPLFKRNWLAIAASFLVLIGAGYLVTTPPTSINQNDEFAFEIDAEEALDYLIENDNLYLSDLMTFDLYEEDEEIEESTMTGLDDIELEELLDELDQEDLEELL